MYTYLIKSNYLTDERIENYFKDKDWRKFDPKKDQNPTLIYLDGMNIYDKSIYKFDSFIKNQISNDKDFLSDKDNLPNIIQKKYQMKTYLINLKKSDLEDYKKLFKNKIYILKPARGREGIGIKIVDNYEDFFNYLRDDIKKYNFKKIKRLDDWVLQEYIINPSLYLERKFHLRIYFMVFENNLYLYPHYLIITAKKKYQNKNFHNKDIHDSHYGNSIRNKIFPEDTNYKKKEVEFIQEQVFNVFKFLKSKMKKFACYSEDKNCYEIFAMDAMLTEDLKLKVLEINARIGTKGLDLMNRKFTMFEDQLNIVLGKIFDSQKVDNDFYLI